MPGPVVCETLEQLTPATAPRSCAGKQAHKHTRCAVPHLPCLAQGAVKGFKPKITTSRGQVLTRQREAANGALLRDAPSNDLGFPGF